MKKHHIVGMLLMGVLHSGGIREFYLPLHLAVNPKSL